MPAAHRCVPCPDPVGRLHVPLLALRGNQPQQGNSYVDGCTMVAEALTSTFMLSNCLYVHCATRRHV